jgi:hypothetical protein
MFIDPVYKNSGDDSSGILSSAIVVRNRDGTLAKSSESSATAESIPGNINSEVMVSSSPKCLAVVCLQPILTVIRFILVQVRPFTQFFFIVHLVNNSVNRQGKTRLSKWYVRPIRRRRKGAEAKRASIIDRLLVYCPTPASPAR